MLKKITLPLAETDPGMVDPNYAIQKNFTGYDSNECPLFKFNMNIGPTEEYPLSQIPRGLNPRDLDPTSATSKTIQKSTNNPRFQLRNRGILVYIERGSLKLDFTNNTVSFLCNTDGSQGHSDGQHTKDKVDDAVLSDNWHNKNSVNVILIETNPDQSTEEKRDEVNAFNNLKVQTKTSNENLIGTFDEIKNNLGSLIPSENVGFCENQKNMNGDKVQKENSVLQLVNLMSAFFPFAGIWEKGGLSQIASYPRLGESIFRKVLFDDELRPVFNAALPYLEDILSFSDYVQMTVDQHSTDNTEIIRTTGKKAMQEKDIKKRKKHQQTLFSTANKVNGALNKDLMPVVVYGIVSNIFDYNEDNNQFVTEYDLSDMCSIWDLAAKNVVKDLDKIFRQRFEDRGRWADFVQETSLWDRTSQLFKNAIKEYNTTCVKKVA
jgi:hypothetical protein